MNKPSIRFMIVGDYGQLGAVNDFKYNYLKSTALKEIVDNNFEELTVNHRSDASVLELYSKVKELTAADFSNSTDTKQHLCFTNAKRIQVNHMMMERDKKKKKKMLVIPKNDLNPKSQTVRLVVGAPVMCIWNRKSLGLIKECSPQNFNGK